MSRKISEFTSDNTITNNSIIPYVDLDEASLANRNKIIDFSNLKSQILNPDTLTVVIEGALVDKTHNLILNSPYSFNITRATTILGIGTCTLNVLGQAIPVTTTILDTNFSPSLNVETGSNLTISISNAVSATDLSLTLVLERI